MNWSFPIESPKRCAASSPWPWTAAVSEPAPARQDLGTGSTEPPSKERHATGPPGQNPFIELLTDLTFFIYEALTPPAQLL